MRSGQLGTPYHQRIAAFREREDTVDPPGCDRSKASDRRVPVDAAGNPPALVSRGTCLESHVIAFPDRAENTNRHFRILDCERGGELHRVEGRKLSPGSVFDFKAAGERLSLVIS